MNDIFAKIFRFFRAKKNAIPSNEYSKRTIIGSWRLVAYTDNLGEAIKSRWKEVWSLAAMDEAETNGIYVCDYINLHSVVGKWFMQGNNRIKLVRKESDNDYCIVELTEVKLVLQKEIKDSHIEYLTFEKVV